MDQLIIHATTDKPLESYMYPWKRIDRYPDKVINKTGQGLLLKYCGKQLAITCYHVISYTEHIKGYINSKGIVQEIPLKVITVCPELDIAILECVDRIDVLTTIDCFKYSMATLPSKVTTQHLTFKPNSRTKKIEQFTILIKGVVYQNINGVSTPQIPYIVGVFEDEKAYDKMHGMSGNPVWNNTGMLGVITSNKKRSKDIYILPTACVYKVLQDYRSNYPISFLSSFVVQGAVAEINENTHGIVVDSYTDIVYIRDTKKLKPGQPTKFKEGDIITKINENSISPDGNVLSNRMKISMPVSSVVALEVLTWEYFTVQLYRLKGESDYRDIKVKFQGIPSYMVRTVPFTYLDVQYTEYNGLILREIDEEFIRYLSLIGYNIKGVIKKYLEDERYKSSKEYRTVALVSTDPKKLNKSLVTLYKKAHLPIHKSKNNVWIAVVTKLGSYKIKNLDDVHKVLEKNDSPTITYTFDGDTIGTVNYEKTEASDFYRHR